MTKEEKILLFNVNWEKLMCNIGESENKYDNKKAIKLSGFYFTRVCTEIDDKNYDCIICYKDWSNELHIPHTNQRATKVIILKRDLLDYFLNGWDRLDEIEYLSQVYKRHYGVKKYLQENCIYYETTQFLDACQGMRDCKRERDRIMYEKKCVEILLEYMELKELE